MPNPRLASRYAKSLVDLATEQGKLENTYQDMLYLQRVCAGNRDFTNLLRSPVISSDKKQAVINAVAGNNVSPLTASFNKLLVDKGRESDLPEIIAAFIDQYNGLNNIHRVKLTTAVPASDDFKNLIIAKVKAEAGLENVELETKVDEKLIGGFKLEFNNKLVDASILRDLNDVRKQFAKNIFIQNIR